MCADWSPPEFDTGTPHSARIYDWWAGGKDNFPVDREAAQRVAEARPGVLATVRENRAFLRRGVDAMAREHGIRQFLDIGTGLPSPGSTHEIAQAVDPSSRVLYVDNDPMVLAHARARLTDLGDRTVGYLDADLRSPESILASAELKAALDLDRPVALMLLAILHFVPDDDEARGIVRRLMDALAPGSMLMISLWAEDRPPAEQVEATERYADTGIPVRMRTPAECAGFFEGLEPLDPGLVPVSQWRRTAADGAAPSLADVALYGGVARKPGGPKAGRAAAAQDAEK
ncbi:SAM-dependent methyltransferase [Phaeacidiphilus oryzae]|uniref:SAM-dependent methyltransferase n=1 Tax=Phaeacidiphilus oryzae TaxID=348818 RepID=UPI0006909F4E|nr:SAM-dependent methyltransferase [Phaeacidiphilus oryzae]